MESVQFGNSRISFSLSRKELKRIAITVNEDCTVSVVAPIGCKMERVLEVVHKKGAWILGKQALVRKRVRNTTQREFVSGEGFIYLGRSCRLKIEGERVVLINGKLFAPKTNTHDLIVQWYKEKALAKFKERVRLLSPHLPVKPSQVILGDQKNRWGSCDKNGVLRINWRVIIAPLRIVDYVLVHELAHLKHDGHGEDFWRLVESVLPDYLERKEWLRVNGGTLEV